MEFVFEVVGGRLHYLYKIKGKIFKYFLEREGI